MTRAMLNRFLAGFLVVSAVALISQARCQDAPMILVQPQTQSIPRGEDVKFTVSAIGTAPLAGC